MDDLRSWLKEIDRLELLKRVEGADPDLEIGIITELNCRRKGPTLLFDNIRGSSRGRRIVTGTILDAPRLGLALGYRGIRSSEDLVARLEGKMSEHESAASKYPACEVSNGPILENNCSDPISIFCNFPPQNGMSTMVAIISERAVSSLLRTRIPDE